MSFQATVYNVMVASPSDVEESALASVREAIARWNAMHAQDKGVVLLPRSWRTHSSPELGDRPQAILNKQLIGKSDLLIAIFWMRIGTATGEAESGTVEEIREHRSQGKPVMIYFCKKPAHPDSFDSEQQEKLRLFQSEVHGLYDTYTTDQELREKVERHLNDKVRDDPYFTESRLTGSSTPRPADVSLTDEAFRLLATAAKSNDLRFDKIKTAAGLLIRSGKSVLVNGGDARTTVGWNKAIEQLCGFGLCRDETGKGQVFQLTQEGLDFFERETERRFTAASEIYVQATIRKTITGEELSGGQLFNHIVRLSKSVVEDAGIEWDSRFILEDQNFRNLVLSKVASRDTERVLQEMRGSSLKLEKAEFYEGDPRSLGKDYERLGDGCLLWNV